MQPIDLAGLFAQEGKDLAAVVADSQTLTAAADSALADRDKVAADGATAMAAKQAEVDAANAVADQALADAVQKRDAKMAQVKAEVDYIVKLAQTLGQDTSGDPTDDTPAAPPPPPALVA